MPAQGMYGLVAAAVVSVCASGALAAPITIDTFESGGLSDAVFGYGSNTKEETAGGIIDGWRQVTVSALGSGGGGSVSYGIAMGRIGLFTGTVESTYTGKWELFYGPNNDVRMDKDLVDGTNTGFVIDLISAEYAFTLAIEVLVAPLDPPDLYATFPAAAYPANPNPHSIFVPFSAFTQDPGFSFTGVDYLTFTFRGAENGDYVIDEIRTDVPEPLALTFFGASLAVLLRRRSCPLSR